MRTIHQQSLVETSARSLATNAEMQCRTCACQYEQQIN